MLFAPRKTHAELQEGQVDVNKLMRRAVDGFKQTTFMSYLKGIHNKERVNIHIACIYLLPKDWIYKKNNTKKISTKIQSTKEKKYKKVNQS